MQSALETTYYLLLNCRGKNKLSSSDKSEFLGALESLHDQDTKDLFKRLEDGQHIIGSADEVD